MSESPSILTAEQKQTALERALTSQTFARSETLKSFLKYVCEMEMTGRGGEISEYLIGVEALGRAPGYSPGEDSSVRNRAHALRQKLQEFYSQEQPDAHLRIELPKGSYCPHFIAHEAPAKMEEITPLTSTPPQSALESPPLVSRRGSLFLAFLAGMLLTALAVVLVYLTGRTSPERQQATLAPVVREAWGPLVARDANVLVCVATPVQLVARQFNGPPPADVLWTDIPAELTDFYQKRHQLDPAGKLYLLPTHNSPMWGDAVGVATIAKILAAAGTSFQVLPERVVSFPSMRNRNVIFFGRPEFSPAIAQLHRRGVFYIDFDEGIHDYAIINRAPHGTEPGLWALKREGQRIPEDYGLITVLPSEGADEGQQRLVVISSLTSAGAQAAAEFFSSPHQLLVLQEKLQAEGHRAFPSSWQVIVKTTADAILPLSYSYVAHRVLP